MTRLSRVPQPDGGFRHLEPRRNHALEDFEHPDGLFMRLFHQHFPDSDITGRVLELGCRSAAIAMSFAQAFPTCRVDGVEGASTLLGLGRKRVAEKGLQGRITLIEGQLPDVRLSRERYQLVISHCLLRHLADPGVLWKTVRQHAAPHAFVFVMDLCRPETAGEATRLVRRTGTDHSDGLQRDLYETLSAAYRPAEVVTLLEAEGIGGLRVEEVGDRHLLVWGVLGAGR